MKLLDSWSWVKSPPLKDTVNVKDTNSFGLCQRILVFQHLQGFPVFAFWYIKSDCLWAKHNPF